MFNEPDFTRRRFLHATALAAGAAFLEFPTLAEDEAAAIPKPYRWFPQIPVPEEIWVVPPTDDVQEGMVLESGAGLAALAGLEGQGKALIYEQVHNDGYQRWFNAFCEAHGSTRVVSMTLDEAVSRLYRADVVRGYLQHQANPQISLGCYPLCA